VGSILDYMRLYFTLGMTRTHFLKLKRLQYRGLKIALGLIQSTPHNSLGVLIGLSPRAKRCMYLNNRYLVTLFYKDGHPLREWLEIRLNSERCMKRFA
jgi:hypothetical protein